MTNCYMKYTEVITEIIPPYPKKEFSFCKNKGIFMKNIGILMHFFQQVLVKYKPTNLLINI